jgi:hypothetical protein
MIRLILAILLLSQIAKAQTIKLYFADDTTNTNLAGQVINKGDTFDVVVFADGNGNTSSRSLYFDFEFQNDAFEFISINHTGTMGNGGIIPSGSQVSSSFFLYPGYSFNKTSTNNTSNGNTNYNFAQYNYTQGGNKTILRYYLNWAVQSGGLGKDRLLVLRFKLRTTAPGFAWNPILMNFGASFNQNGTAGSTIMTTPLTNVIMLDPTASKYVTASIETNNNLDPYSLTRVHFVDTLTNQGFFVDAISNGSLPIDQTKLKPNTVYKIFASVNMDSMVDLYKGAVTVSDYTTAQAEFITQNLDGTFKNQSIVTGAGYYSADVNNNRAFDGGDLVRLYAQTVGVDSLAKLPAGYAPGTDMYMSVPTFTDSTFNALNQNIWKNITAPFVLFKTQEIGKNLPLKLKYVLKGDINRSHSSQVIRGTDIVSNAIPSLKKNLGSPKANLLINTPQNIPAIDVAIKSVTVVSNSIEIPVEVKTGTYNVSALQFEFIYDPTKIKFESIASDLPNTWQTFVDNKPGRLKFGSLDRELKQSINGNLIPFKVKFSTLVPGAEINSAIRVSPVMDASSKTGYQLGINLNSDLIRLTGIKNF